MKDDELAQKIYENALMKVCSAECLTTDSMSQKLQEAERTVYIRKEEAMEFLEDSFNIDIVTFPYICAFAMVSKTIK